MTQDARDQEHSNSDQSNPGQPDSAPSDKAEQPDSAHQSEVGDNEDLAAAFLRETEVVEEAVEDGKKIRRRGIYLLPNLFTTSALFAGFFAVVAGINGEFTSAAVAIFIAMVLDGLDGRVARMTNTQSEFGAEYDSLADMVSFGMAPALVAFTWILQDIGKTGWVVAFLYVACAALRLARFNVQIGSVDKKWFIGLPSPSAAALVAASVWTFHSFDADAFGFKLLMLVVVAAAGVLMVSNIRYYSFKDLDFKKPVPFVVLLAIVLAFVLISVEPSVMLLLLFGTYVASGPVLAVMRKAKTSR
ncbi:CDP-diacylglycerol--serine O-phosphatidyltransferase [Vreelandella titanicae]|jgi:CDP-diacylglycerol--serine O-phosphatidyltransferase|nr:MULTISPECIES: CDP-diacylglycerol--serine O-phosphatidyltransferase [Halomonas]NAO98542.1 CDP-diacylglycerol--serine O-phosphatidyltransferase [Halomonas sp. MG34]QGQ71432.1 CDP-diacylglycerol--serine O-phosphatidyltransferase [Halomonas sp. PA16-9]KIN13166.1 CDP-diacylglycerol--serine O-phosphatidyltransferase [Halomonas sp. KHS3]MCD1588692.1 CDP-diacylglycerol--serine O-phosphatidyltransferase [Halomonas sp. IOP_14]NVE92208.1 CDP-diacylglycerol--serine O-phosphatidyltransferase [Halomonas |tara:strand:+ start:6667 stop:7572 length:906 start_codon:yes stop_codon:yes gene_type:complete